ncbi:MAG: hypothetical protein KID04_16225 [Clostridium sp.]|nr:hypothetical protein [Clostridium sp.]
MNCLSIDLQWKLTTSRFEEWLKEELFHFKWWILLAVFILSIFIWWKSIDKSRLSELVLFAGIVCIFILILDEWGEDLALWDYPVKIFPLFPPISAIDLASLPFLYSLIYQYFSTWKSYTIASIIMSVLSCFVMEPLFILSGIYQVITWKTYYGLPLYFAIAICSKFILAQIKKIESKTN